MQLSSYFIFFNIKNILHCILYRKSFGPIFACPLSILIPRITINRKWQNFYNVETVIPCNFRNIPNTKRLNSLMGHQNKAIFFKIIMAVLKKFINKIYMFWVEFLFPLETWTIAFLWKSSMRKVPDDSIKAQIRWIK